MHGGSNTEHVRGGSPVGRRSIPLKLGQRDEVVQVPEENLVTVVEPRERPAVPDPVAEVRRALAEPIVSPRLCEMVRPGQKVAIMVSDITRPAPTSVLLPPLLRELSSAGVREHDVTIVFGMGIHRRHSPEEQRALVGDGFFKRFRCVDSSELEVVNLGETSRGTPLEVARPVAEADVRVATGNIELHYFAGYTGGAKAFMPGASTRKAIEHNHAMQLLPGAAPGRIEGNPVREDIDEFAKRIGAAFIVNAVLNSHKEIVACLAGHLIEAHREGCKLVDSMYKVEIPEPADIVVASAGGAPKDINVYQAQKALDNARWAVRPGGIIILIASCREGFGESTFERWIMEARTAHDLIERLKRGFVLGGHKAAAIARVLEVAQVWLVSELPPGVVRSLMFRPFGSGQEALDRAIAEKGNGCKVIVMPRAGVTLPCTPGVRAGG